MVCLRINLLLKDLFHPHGLPSSALHQREHCCSHPGSGSATPCCLNTRAGPELKFHHNKRPFKPLPAKQKCTRLFHVPSSQGTTWTKWPESPAPLQAAMRLLVSIISIDQITSPASPRIANVSYLGPRTSSGPIRIRALPRLYTDTSLSVRQCIFAKSLFYSFTI